jgi:hypothetical protein
MMRTAPPHSLQVSQAGQHDGPGRGGNAGLDAVRPGQHTGDEAEAEQDRAHHQLQAGDAEVAQEIVVEDALAQVAQVAEEVALVEQHAHTRAVESFLYLRPVNSLGGVTILPGR